MKTVILKSKTDTYTVLNIIFHKLTHIRKIACATILIFVSVVLCYGAKTYSPEDVPDVHRTDGSMYVSDPEGILSAGTVTRINSEAMSLQDKTGIEIAVVVVPSIGSYTPEDFSERLFRKWGVGQKGKDNGLLILLATEDRYVRFETGYGIEGILTDALSKRIQTTVMNPYLSKGDWDNGLLAGVKAVSELIADPNNGLTESTNANNREDTDNFLLIVTIMLFTMLAIVIFSLVIYNRGKKCPRCGSKMEVIDESSQNISPGIRMITTTYKCPKCGYVMRKNKTQNIGASLAGGLGGGLGIPGRGYGRGSVGGRPGGWGGGRSGGGGATSKF